MEFKFDNNGSVIGVVLIAIAAVISMGAAYYLINDGFKNGSDNNKIKLSDNGQTVKEQESEEALADLCGNGKCDDREVAFDCAANCGDGTSVKAIAECGNDYCNAGETVENCAADCKVPTDHTPLCNDNGVCETGEKGGYVCMKDCACGDGLCDPGENITTCEKDCSILCLREGQTAYTYSKDSRITFWSGHGCCEGFALVGRKDGDSSRYICVKTKCVSEENKEIINSAEYSGCCGGLQQNWLPSSGNPNFHFSCTKCGNGICDYGETSGNCPRDCACTKLNESPTDGNLCCQGLTKINNFYQIDSQGKCVPKADTTGIKTVCVNCGDGECDVNEDKCNCAKDCGSAIESCGNGQCEADETMASCAIDCEPKTKKPVIYLYPQKIEKVNVMIDYDGEIVADYPDYDPLTGWNVIAYPDGHLINQFDGKEYSYLFWEGGDFGANYDFTKGFIVKGSGTKSFLQDILAKIGLTPKEYNEFIVYWYPKMKDNSYNLIHFATEEYTSRARLEITPKPDSILRVFMVFKPLQAKIDVMPQTFMPFIRKGFAVVEWGGSELK